MPYLMPVKFRIRIANKWHYWGFIDGVWCNPPYNYGKVKKISDKDLMERSRLWTGKKDRDGVEIYQCDLLRIDELEPYISKPLWEVLWLETMFAWGVRPTDRDVILLFCSMDDELKGLETNAKIVGNSEVNHNKEVW